MSMQRSPVTAPWVPRVALGARRISLEDWGAVAAVLLVAIRYRVVLDIPLGLALSAVLLPVTARHLFRYRGALLLAIGAVLAAISGLVITELRSATIDVSSPLLAVQSARVLEVAIVLATLLWARSVLGLQTLALVFGIGMWASLALNGINEDNPVKFSFLVPTILVLLGLPWICGNRGRELVCLGALTTVAALSDARSAATMLVIAVAILLFQGRAVPEALRAHRAWSAMLKLGAVGLACYFAAQAAILEGILGQAAQDRTELQIARSGNAIVGGRPEMGAAASLIGAEPLGYGSGSLVTFDERVLGKEGMWALGYDPDNGYVDNYMFGSGFEVHSVLGDLWLHYGLLGAALAVGLLLAVLHSTALGLAGNVLPAVGLFLALRFAWDFAFSPFASSVVLVPLTLALLLPALQPEAREAPSSP